MTPSTRTPLVGYARLCCAEGRSFCAKKSEPGSGEVLLRESDDSPVFAVHGMGCSMNGNIRSSKKRQKHPWADNGRVMNFRHPRTGDDENSLRAHLNVAH